MYLVTPIFTIQTGERQDAVTIQSAPSPVYIKKRPEEIEAWRQRVTDALAAARADVLDPIVVDQLPGTDYMPGACLVFVSWAELKAFATAVYLAGKALGH